MLYPVHPNRSFVIAGSLALFGLAAILQPSRTPLKPHHRTRRPRRPRWRRRRQRLPLQNLSRRSHPAAFPPTTPPAAIATEERGKSGKAGPDLIASSVTLHDEDGVDIAKFVRHPSTRKSSRSTPPTLRSMTFARLSAFARDYASGRGGVHMSEVLVGDANSGQQYFTAPAAATSAIPPPAISKASPQYDVATAPGTHRHAPHGRGGFGRGAGAPNPTAPYATSRGSGETIKGQPVSSPTSTQPSASPTAHQNLGRNHGSPKSITDPLQAHVDIMMRLTIPKCTISRLSGHAEVEMPHDRQIPTFLTAFCRLAQRPLGQGLTPEAIAHPKAR